MGRADDRLAAALAEQHARRRDVLAGGAAHVGWKLGMGERESIDGRPVIGYLTSAGLLDAGAAYHPDRAADLRADAELALELGRDVHAHEDTASAVDAICGFGAALEFVDLGGTDEAEAVVAANVFHCAVAFGSFRSTRPRRGVPAQLIVDGAVRAGARSEPDVADRICIVARLLELVGERLRAGDRIITGSIVQVPVGPGEEVVADLGELGRVGLAIVSAPEVRPFGGSG